MKTIISYFRYCWSRFVEKAFLGLWRVIPSVLLVAFLFTLPDYTFLKKYLPHEETINYLSDDTSLDEIENVYEVVELRTTNSKTFKKANDAYETILYGYDVHYEVDGVYKEIDNSFAENKDYYSNKANRFSVLFPKSLEDKASLTYQNYTVEWKFNGITGVNVKKRIADNTLSYENVYKNVDLEYEVINDGVKENLVLKKYIENFNFTYSLYTTLEIKQYNNGICLFNDANQHIFTIRPYFMHDFQGNVSYDIKSEIIKVGNDEYLINVTPNDEFLQNASYPVVIDPEIIINGESVRGTFDVKVFEPTSTYYPGYYPQDYWLSYLPITAEGSLSSKLYLRTGFPTSDTYSPMANLDNANLLYAHITMPVQSANCTSSSGCTVKSKIVEGVTWNNLTPLSSFSTTDLSDFVFHNNNSVYQKFDIYDYVRENAHLLGKEFFSFILEFSLEGGDGSYVRYEQPYPIYGFPAELRIGYSNQAGLYDYYTYEQLPASNSAVSYVAHNSGNLITLFSDYTDNNLINISHIYNLNKSHILGNYGYGFRLNYEESIPFANPVYLRLVKGDGSEVEFEKKHGRDYYLAKDGSGDKIIVRNGLFELTTQSNVKKVYNSDNKLYKIYPDYDENIPDNDAIYIEISYSNGRISTIKDYNPNIDTYNTIVYLYYNSSQQLSHYYVYRRNENKSQIIVQNAYFYYNNNRLTQIKKFDYLNNEYFETCNFTYYNNTNKIKTIKDNLTNGLRFTYDAANNRVKKVEQVIPDITETPYLEFHYDNNGRKLTIKDANDFTVSYTFDTYFHTKTVTNSLGYTSFYQYYDIYYPDGQYTPNPNYNLNHKIELISQPFKNDYNLINNHGFELSDGLNYWVDQSTGGNIGLVRTSLYGARALRLTKTGSSGTPKVSQTVKVKSGQTYIVSGYIKNTNTNGNGAKIDISSSDVTINHRTSNPIKGSTEYEYYYIKFTANADGNVSICLINESIGDAYFDMIQMQNNIIDIRYNFLENASFEADATGWSGLSSDIALNEDSKPFDNKITGIKYARFRGKTIQQTVNISGSADDVFVFGCLAFFENKVATGQVELQFKYVDYSTESFIFDFDPNDENVQYIMHKVVASKDYTKIYFKITNDSSNEYLCIDNLGLYKEGYGLKVDYYPYSGSDDIEKICISDEINGSKDEYLYNTNGHLTTVKLDNIYGTIEYEDQKSWIQNIEINNNIVQSFSRDEQGYIKELTLSSNNKYYFSESTQYSSDKLYIVSEEDEYGRITEYTFDYLTGLLSSSKFNNITTTYEYDSLANITNITKGARSVIYNYDGRLLTSITVDGLVYSFEYNEYYDITAIKVAGNTILRNTYEDYNTSQHTSQYAGIIDYAIYGTDIIDFEYDEEKRIKAVSVNDVKQFEYTYDSAGNIAKIVDFKANPDVTYYYNFDELNRLVQVTSTDGNNVTYEYDADGFISSRTNINGRVEYEYESISGQPADGKDINKNLTEEIFTSFTKQYNYGSDGLKRLESTAIITSAATITSQYTYDSFQKTVGEDARIYDTLRIRELEIKKNGTTVIEMVYTYDVYGNIDTINRYDNGVLSVIENFDYDIYNQLTYHYQKIDDVIYETFYDYDNRGNIISIYKEEYGSVFKSSSISLNYKMTGWRDQLTSIRVDGTDYYVGGYDSAGNPKYSYLQWIDGIYFEDGRLQGIYDPWKSVEFEYDGSGSRISKELDGRIVAEYVWDGNNIIKEIRDYYDYRTGTYVDDVLQYYYDTSNNIVGFDFNGTHYTYIKNLQNDIIAIADVSGNIVVKYYYDAYGNIIKIIDSSGIGLGEKNPFRFKSYYYDTETGFYSLQSRYYDPEIGRFINADNQLSTGSDFTGMNLFAYCDNNPVMRVDPTGHAWWHWAIAATVVVACAVAVVATAGGAAPALMAVSAVASGMAAPIGGAAATVSAAAFIGSATYLGVSAMSAAENSSSLSDFGAQGNWGTVAGTVGSAVVAGGSAYLSTRGSTSSTSSGKGTQNPKVKAAVQKGQAMHKQMDYGPGVLKEQKIAPGCRVDGIDFNNKIIYELKPNNPQAISRGLAQLERYTTAASQQYGGEWTGVLKLYD